MKKQKTDPPWKLSEPQRERIVRFVRRKYPQYAKPGVLGEMWATCRDHHIARGTQWVDWEAAFRNWIRTEAKYDARRVAQRSQRRASEQPYDPAMRGKGFRSVPVLFEDIRDMPPEGEA